MACALCVSNPRRDGLCERCFARRVQKRITKALRGCFDDGDVVIFLMQDEGAPTVVLRRILEGVLARSQRKLIVAVEPPQGAYRVVSADTVDVVLARAMHSIAMMGAMALQDGAVRPLSRVSIEECEMVAGVLGVQFAKRTEVSFAGLDALEERQPGTKATLAKALGLL